MWGGGWLRVIRDNLQGELTEMSADTSRVSVKISKKNQIRHEKKCGGVKTEVALWWYKYIFLN